MLLNLRHLACLALVMGLASGCTEAAKPPAEPQTASTRLTPEAITAENFHKIKTGMGQSEVESILGLWNEDVPDLAKLDALASGSGDGPKRKDNDLFVRGGVVADKILKWTKGREPDVVEIAVWLKDGKVLATGQFGLIKNEEKQPEKERK